MQKKTYTLQYSDVDFGHPGLGWLGRSFDIDEEDLHLERYLKAKGVNVRVYNGKAVITSGDSTLEL